MSDKPHYVFLAPQSEHYETLKQVIEETLRERGIEPIDVFDLKPGESLLFAIVKAIEQADFVVVDLTDANPNVMYELGIAHGLRKPVLYTASSGQSIPFEVPGNVILYYDSDPATAERIRKYLKVWAERYTAVANVEE